MLRTCIRSTAVSTVSAIALVVSSQVSAVSFDVDDTKLTIGGYIKGDMIYDSKQDLGDTFATRNILTGTDADNLPEGHFSAHARESRLSISTSTPADDGAVETLFEGDFFGAGGNEGVSNSNGFRLRQAYGSWNGILMGQTWSNFQPLVAIPPTLDFGGPTGYIFNRQAQARYTMMTDNGSFAVALENPEANIYGTTDDKDGLPDITFNYTGNSGNLKYTASGAVTFLEVDDGTTDDSTTGYGAMLAGTYTTASGMKIGGNGGYFDGANRYLYQGGGGGSNNGFFSGGNIVTAGELGLMGYIDVPVSEKTKMMLVIGYSKLDDEAAVVAASDASVGDGDASNDVAETFTSIHANVRYYPVKSVMYGVELMYGSKEMFNGDDGDDTRLQVSGKYSF